MTNKKQENEKKSDAKEKKSRKLVLNDRRKGILESIKRTMGEKKDMYGRELASQKEKLRALQIIFPPFEAMVNDLKEKTKDDEYSNKVIYKLGFHTDYECMQKDMDEANAVINKYPPVIAKIVTDMDYLEKKPREFYEEFKCETLPGGFMGGMEINERLYNRHGDRSGFVTR